MRTASLPLLLGALAILPIAASRSTAQSIGVGAGIALPNDGMAQMTDDLAERGFTGAAENAGAGYYAELRGRFGGDLALTGAIGFNSFPETSSSWYDGEGRTVSLRSSQTVVPVSLGLEMRLGSGFLSPYLSLEGTYSSYHRSFAGHDGGIPVPFVSDESSESRYGVALGGGVNLDLPLVDLQAGARLQMTNLLNRAEGEREVYFLQLGVTAFLGL